MRSRSIDRAAGTIFYYITMNRRICQRIWPDGFAIANAAHQQPFWNGAARGKIVSLAVYNCYSLDAPLGIMVHYP